MAVRPKYRIVRSTRAKLLEKFAREGVTKLQYPTTGEVSVARAYPELFEIQTIGRRSSITMK